MSWLTSWACSVLGNGWILGAILAAANLMLAGLRGLPARLRHLVSLASLLAVPALSSLGACGDGGIRVIAERDEAVPWLLVGLWTAGVLLLAIRELGGHLRFGRAAARWRPATVAERRAAGVGERTPLRVGRAGRPMTYGLRRPGIYLPVRALRELDGESLAAVVRHEADHVRWRDPLLWAVARGVRILCWPVAPLWILEHLIHREAEAGADAAAVAGRDLGERRSYGNTLLTVATWESAAGATGSGTGLTGGRLARRLRALVRRRRAAAPAGLAACLLLALTGLALVAAPRMHAGPDDDGPQRQVIRRVFVERPTGR